MVFWVVTSFQFIDNIPTRLVRDLMLGGDVFRAIPRNKGPSDTSSDTIIDPTWQTSIEITVLSAMDR